MTDTLLLLALFLAVVAVGTLVTAVYDVLERSWWGTAEAAVTHAPAPVRSSLRTERAAPVSVVVRQAAPRRSEPRVVAVRVRA